MSDPSAPDPSGPDPSGPDPSGPDARGADQDAAAAPALLRPGAPLRARRPRPPLFLVPERYRRRRLMDGARMLPVVGAFLFALPILWQTTSEGHNTATEGLYLFAVWAGLVLVARLLAGPLLAAGSDPAVEQDEDPAEAGGDGGG